MHFEKTGTANTEKTAALALKTAAERNIRHIVAAFGDRRDGPDPCES